MSFVDDTLAAPRPGRLADLDLPRRTRSFPSPGSWADEVVYFLVVDRFSDGAEATRPLLDRANLAAARPASPDGEAWRWDRWATSGGERWQGGTLTGVLSKLDYLRDLGVTTVWLSPVFRQRGHLDTYHGYGIQDFLDVDPRFGTRADLVELVRQAHTRGMRVLLEVIFNHSGANWLYPGDERKPAYTSGRHPFGSWLGDRGQPVAAIGGADDGVWPEELATPDTYTRAGTGNLGAGGLEDDAAEFRRTDFEDLRDFALEQPGVLSGRGGRRRPEPAGVDPDRGGQHRRGRRPGHRPPGGQHRSGAAPPGRDRVRGGAGPRRERVPGAGHPSLRGGVGGGRTRTASPQGPRCRG